MMKGKKLLTSAVALALLLGTFSVHSFAAGFTAAQARELAKKQVPSGCTYLKTELDDGYYEVEYYLESKSEKHEVKISTASQKIVSYKTDRDGKGSAQVSLSKAQAKKLVTDEISGAEIVDTLLESDDGLKEYKIRFKTDSLYGSYEINPNSGAILEREIKIGTAPASWTGSVSSSSGSSSSSSGPISSAKARELALKVVPGATITDFDLDDGVYEIELYKDGYEYDVEFSAATGKQLSYSRDRDDDYWDDRYNDDWDDDWYDHHDWDGHDYHGGHTWEQSHHNGHYYAD